MCVSETRACNRGTEGGENKLIGDEEWGGDWKWFFTTGVDKHLLDEKHKLQMNGKSISPEMRIQTTEYAGCATIIHKRLWHLIADVRPINGRIMKTKLDTTPKSIVFSVYAPQAGADTQSKHEFYDGLEKEMGRGGARKNVLILVAGDFNARIGHARNREEERVIGPHPLETAADRAAGRLRQGTGEQED